MFRQAISKAQATFFLCLIVMYVSINVPPAILPLIRISYQVEADRFSLFYFLYSLAVISTAGLAGRFGDIYGRKTVCCFGTALVGAGSLCIGLSVSFGMVLAGRVLQGFGVSAISSSAVAGMLEHTDSAEKGLLAKLATFALPCGVLGGLLAAALFTKLSWHPQSSPLVACAAAGFIAMTMLMFQTVKRTVRDTESKLVRQLSQFLWRPASLIFISSCVQTTIFTFPELIGLHAGSSEGSTEVIYALCVYMAVSCLIIIAAPNWDTMTLCRVGMLATAIGAVSCLAAVRESLVWSYLCALLFGISHGATNLGSVRFVDQISSPQSKAFNLGVFNTIRYVGAGLPVLLVGSLAATTSMGTSKMTFWLAIACGGVSCLFFCRNAHRQIVQGV